MKITETYDIPENLNGIEYAVSTRKRLNKSVHFQIFIDPKRVERCRVKAREEHIHHDQQIKFFVLHSQRNILIIVLKFIAISAVVRVEHCVIVGNCRFEEVTRGLIKRACILGIFLVKNSVLFAFVRAVAVNNRDTQLFIGLFVHLPLEFFIIQFCHLNRRYRENGIKPIHTLLAANFLDFSALVRGYIFDICQSIKIIRFFIAVCFRIEMIKNIFGNFLNSFGSAKSLFAIDIPDFFVINIIRHIHSFNIVYAERQNIFIIDRVNDSISVQSVAENLLGCAQGRILTCSGIDRKNRSSRKSEQMILLEFLDNRLMHIAELTAVTFVKNNHNAL